jgi:hypothetical protein
MKTQSDVVEPATTGAAKRRVWRWALVGIVFWAAVAYLVAPDVWKYYLDRTKPLPDVDRVTHTSDGHPGDPVNIALVGSEELVIKSMHAAGWLPADPITVASSVRIAVDTVLRKSDDTAPVSPLYLFGRKQDLAFEQPVPGGPAHRHHVRFWRWDQLRDDQPVWFGSATYDERAGLSYTTGQITHHIGPDVDSERDRIAAELLRLRWSGGVEWIDGFHRQHEGRNGGGDLWRTDGRLAVIRLSVPQ